MLEPLQAYKQYYEREYRRNAEEAFDALLKRSGISLEENRRTVAAYDAKMAKVNELNSLLSRDRGVRVFLFVLAVFGAVLFFVGLFLLGSGDFIWGSVLLVLGVLLAVLPLVFIFGKINPVLKKLGEEREKRRAEAEKFLREAWEQMAPLNALFDDAVTKQLVEKTIPIKLDANFNMRRYDYLCAKYGFGEPNDPERSTIGILTGEIGGNPFVIDRELVHTMGTCTYSGSIVISWTTTYTDPEGNSHTETHTQTLVATIVRPKPYYSEQTRLIYGNEAAPDLHFTHTPTHVERMSEGARQRTVKRGTKRIRKQQEREMTDGDPTTNFTAMGNEEFDALFGALDRDNEVQFRLLFTPLAQKNMIALMTDPAGYGDDFNMRKSGCLNFVSSEHSASWDLDADYRRYFSYSADLAKQTFVGFNCDYFKHLFFDLAPVLSIPLYQQYKPQEYFYPEKYPRNYTPYESEYLANLAGQNAFCHPQTATPAILKTEFEREEGKSDRIRVTAYSYRAEDRVDFVTEFGGDGNYHEVPVHWVEYIPVCNTETAVLKELGLSKKEFDVRSGGGPLLDALRRYGAGASGYGHGMLCCKIGEDVPFDEEFADFVSDDK